MQPYLLFNRSYNIQTLPISSPYLLQISSSIKNSRTTIT